MNPLELIKSVKILRLEPDDYLVVHVDGGLDAGTHDEIRASLICELGTDRVLLLAGPIQLGVLTFGEAA